MKHDMTEWHIYRTRFLVRARQLTEPLLFVDALGREHQGDIGDYLVESSDGSSRIAPREIFEDIYVAMAPGNDSIWSAAALRHSRISTPAAQQPELASAARSLLRTAGSAYS
jgi:hypothetical protein